MTLSNQELKADKISTANTPEKTEGKQHPNDGSIKACLPTNRFGKAS